MKPFGTMAAALTAAGSALVAGAVIAGTMAAQAQTAVTRQITSEPVDITQGPGGTAVTRRILTPEPGFTTYGAPPDQYVPLAGDALAPQYVEPTAPALIPRREAVTTRTTTVGVSPRASARARTARAEATRIEATRTATRRAAPPPSIAVAAPAVSDQALALNAAQRQVIYRTLVQREVYPAPAPFAAPAASRDYPLRTIYPADNSYGSSGYGDYAYGGYADRAYTSRAYGYQDDNRNLDPYHTAYRWNGIPLVVGARIPASVPLIALPESVAARVPAAGPYSYAVLDNRVFLVDPSTGIIVAAIAP
ncbi:MAG TPA: DUF1236 domain-containing protein [Xanthobacteraceae bacterium]